MSRIAFQIRTIINSVRLRAVLFQALILAAVLAGAAYLAGNTLHNLKVRGIATGFHFLSSESGFGIIQHLIAYDETSTFGRVFLVGLLNTLLVSVLGIIGATVLGFIVGISRLSRNWLVSKLAAGYIETFRNIPLLLQIFFWYFGVLRALPPPRGSIAFGEAVFLNIRGVYLPSPVFVQGFTPVGLSAIAALAAIIGLLVISRRRRLESGAGLPRLPIYIGLSVLLPVCLFFLLGRPVSFELPRLEGFNFTGGIVLIPELAALLVALCIYTAAFIAEIVRAGIQSVQAGQTEAARALGLLPWQRLRLVVIPQALRVIIPPLTNQYLNLTKNSSLAAAIGYPDLVSVFAGSTLNQTGQAVEVIAITMGVYLTISLAISFTMTRYNRMTAWAEG